MELRKCDGKGCNLISPDENGLHVANHWTTVKTSHGIKDGPAGRLDRSWHEKELCEKCMEKFEQIFQ